MFQLLFLMAFLQEAPSSCFLLTRMSREHELGVHRTVTGQLATSSARNGRSRQRRSQAFVGRGYGGQRSPNSGFCEDIPLGKPGAAWYFPGWAHVPSVWGTGHVPAALASLLGRSLSQKECPSLANKWYRRFMD